MWEWHTHFWIDTDLLLGLVIRTAHYSRNENINGYDNKTTVSFVFTNMVLFFWLVSGNFTQLIM